MGYNPSAKQVSINLKPGVFFMPSVDLVLTQTSAAAQNLVQTPAELDLRDLYPTLFQDLQSTAAIPSPVIPGKYTG